MAELTQGGALTFLLIGHVAPAPLRPPPPSASTAIGPELTREQAPYPNPAFKPPPPLEANVTICQPLFAPMPATSPLSPPAAPDAPRSGLSRPPAPDAPRSGLSRPPAPDAPRYGLSRPPAPDAPRSMLTRPPAPDAPRSRLSCPPAPDAPRSRLTRPPAPDAPRSRLCCPPAPDTSRLSCPPAFDTPSEAPEFYATQLSSLDTEREMKGPDGQPGYPHVLRLAKALVAARNLLGLSDQRVDRLIVLWQHLSEYDKRRVDYPNQYRERIPLGRFKATKRKSTVCPGKYSLQCCFLGLNSGHASWPSASRLVEAICSQLCRIHPAATQSRGIRRTRWNLILADYVGIREAVLDSPRLMARTQMQLYMLNQKTLKLWFSERQKRGARTILEQGLVVIPAPSTSAQPLPPPMALSCQQVGQGQPFIFVTEQILEQGFVVIPAPSIPAQPLPPPMAMSCQQVGQGQPFYLVPVDHSRQATQLVPILPIRGPPPPPLQLRVPRTTAFRKRKAAMAAAAAGQVVGPPKKARPYTPHVCSKCGQPKRLETGHTRIAGVSYCAVVGGKSVEEWRAEMKDTKERIEK